MWEGVAAIISETIVILQLLFLGKCLKEKRKPIQFFLKIGRQFLVMIKVCKFRVCFLLGSQIYI